MGMESHVRVGTRLLCQGIAEGPDPVSVTGRGVRTSMV